MAFGERGIEGDTETILLFTFAQDASRGQVPFLGFELSLGAYLAFEDTPCDRFVSWQNIRIPNEGRPPHGSLAGLQRSKC